MVGLISDGDETAYREEVQSLTTWCSANNLALNTTKTKEIIVDFRRKKVDHPPLYINGEGVERVHDFRFLGVQISDDLTWTLNITAIIKKAQQRLHFLRVLRKNNLEQKLLLSFYRSTMESLLTYCLTTWYGAAPLQTEGGAEDSEGSTEDRGLPSPLPDGHLLHPVRQQSSQH